MKLGAALFGALFCCLIAGNARADTGYTPPMAPAQATFVDQNGIPLAGGQVYFYVPGTTTPKNTYQDPGLTTLNPNPITLDSSGRASIYGTGAYRQQVYDASGNLIWDQITTVPLAPGVPITTPISTTNTTAATSPTTGAIISSGGIGATGAIWGGSGFFVPLGSVGNKNSIWTNNGATAPSLINRLFVGAAAAVNPGNAPESPADWAETFWPSSTQNSQAVSISTIGQNAVLGASRSSDYPISATTQGGYAISGLSLNDNLSFADSVYGAYVEADRASGVTGPSIGIESDAGNNGSVVAIHPAAMHPDGLTVPMWAACGGAGFAGVGGSANCSAAIGIVPNTKQFEAGIVFDGTALDSAVGAGSGGVAIEMNQGQSLRWLGVANATEAEIWGSPDGLTLNQSFLSIANSNGAYPSYSGIGGMLTNNFSAGGAEVDVINTDSAATSTFQVRQITGTGTNRLVLNVLASGAIVTVLPTSCSGQETGTLWNSSGVVNICP